VAFGGDLSTIDGVRRLAADVRAAIRTAGRSTLDVLVNNAGVAEFVDFPATSEETFDRTFAVNVKAPYFLTQALIDLVPSGGRVIFTTSVVTDVYFAGVPAYAASKGAIDTLIRYLAGELGGRGVRVTGVAPGAIETDTAAWMASDEGKAQAKSVQALQDVASPAEIADVIGFLAGPDARWLTGTVVNASGGTRL
jgi:NAD(P)-dependent dehydrogenase (short-subunit alcohol dehydrogenase family)